uniref:Uncharacterized protein n=1 Tax=Anguilla anguilla TaxID=7936 RepID=A0A0E9RJF9_ANGAN
MYLFYCLYRLLIHYFWHTGIHFASPQLGWSEGWRLLNTLTVCLNRFTVVWKRVKVKACLNLYFQPLPLDTSIH